MSEHPSTQTLRASALQLLAAGNSLESVAHVLEVSVETLQAWMAQPASALPADEPIAPASHTLRFPGTRVYAVGPMGRCAMFALSLLVAGCPVLAWPFVSGPPRQAGTMPMFVLGTALACLLAVLALLHARTARFELRPDAIAKWTLGGVTILPYAQIVGLDASRQRKSASWKVALHTRPGTPSMTIYPEDAHLRDPDLVAWLNAIPRKTGDPVRPPADDAAATPGAIRVLGAFVNVAMLLGLLLVGPFNSARAVLTGYPPLERLNLTEGTLTWIAPCVYLRHGASYLAVGIRRDGIERRERLDCTFDRSVIAGPAPYHIRIWRDTRMFSDNAVRQVELDGRVLQDYAGFLARARRFDPAMFVWQLMMASMLGVLFYGMTASNRRNG